MAAIFSDYVDCGTCATVYYKDVTSDSSGSVAEYHTFSACIPADDPPPKAEFKPPVPNLRLPSVRAWHVRVNKRTLTIRLHRTMP